MVRVIRWIDDTGKKWIHPIEESLDGKKIKKQVGRITKVVGATKVHIPNPLHPVVPYNVLILEDENGNRMPKKTIRDYEVGDEYKDEPNESDSAVSAIKIKYDFFEAVDEALEMIGSLSVDDSSKVLIKPNAGIPGYYYVGICTNPKVLEATIQVLLNKGVKKENITIAEQSFFVPFEKAIAKSGIPELAKKFGVNVVDIGTTEFEKKQVREFAFEVSKIVEDVDLVLNIPVIKTDMVLGMTGAFENLTRFLSKDNFNLLASDPKKAALALSVLPQVFPKFVTIGDASIGMQGNGPAQHGEPGFFDLIFAAKNPVVHDKAVQEVLCLRKLPFVELAGKLGLGEYEISKISFVGNELEALRRDIKHPIGSKLIKK